jgi:hypothetical protein
MAETGKNEAERARNPSRPLWIKEIYSTHKQLKRPDPMKDRGR